MSRSRRQNRAGSERRRQHQACGPGAPWAFQGRGQGVAQPDGAGGRSSGRDDGTEDEGRAGGKGGKEMGERTPLEETKGQSLKLPEKPSVLQEEKRQLFLQLGKVFT